MHGDMCPLKKCDAEDDEVIEARVRMKGQEKQWSSRSRRGTGGPGRALDPLGEAGESAGGILACLNSQSSHTKTTLCSSVTVVSKGSRYCH